MIDAITTIDPATLERIFRAVRRIEAADLAGGELRAVTGVPRATPVLNASGLAVPAGACAWMSGDPSDHTDGVVAIYRAEYPGVSRLVIAADEIPIGSTGLGWMEGLVRVRVEGWDDLSVGDRLGARFDSWDAMADPLGPLLITAMLDSPFVAARLTGERGDHKMCDCGDGGPSGPYHTILFAAGHTVTEDSPGNLTVRA